MKKSSIGALLILFLGVLSISIWYFVNPTLVEQAKSNSVDSTSIKEKPRIVGEENYSHLKTLEKPESAIDGWYGSRHTEAMFFWISLGIGIIGLVIALILCNSRDRGSDDPYCIVGFVFTILGAITALVSGIVWVSDSPNANELTELPAGRIVQLYQRDQNHYSWSVNIALADKLDQETEVVVPQTFHETLQIGMAIPHFQILKEGDFLTLRALPAGIVVYKSDRHKIASVDSDVQLKFEGDKAMAMMAGSYGQIYITPSDAPEVLILAWIPKAIYDQLRVGMLVNPK